MNIEEYTELNELVDKLHNVIMLLVKANVKVDFIYLPKNTSVLSETNLREVKADMIVAQDTCRIVKESFRKALGDIGDQDCRKTVYDVIVLTSGSIIRTFDSMSEAILWVGLQPQLKLI